MYIAGLIWAGESNVLQTLNNDSAVLFNDVFTMHGMGVGHGYHKEDFLLNTCTTNYISMVLSQKMDLRQL